MVEALLIKLPFNVFLEPTSTEQRQLEFLAQWRNGVHGGFKFNCHTWQAIHQLHITITCLLHYTQSHTTMARLLGIPFLIRL